jgi:hypothetical protein
MSIEPRSNIARRPDGNDIRPSHGDCAVRHNRHSFINRDEETMHDENICALF